jgi:hypothetical protein
MVEGPGGWLVRLHIPGPGAILVSSVALTVWAVESAARVVAQAQGTVHPLLQALFLGIGFSIPIVLAVWTRNRDKRNRDQEHLENILKLDRIIVAVEGEEGLIADRRINRERRHSQANDLQQHEIRLDCMERFLRKQGYEPPIEPTPHRRTSDPDGQAGR